MRLLDRLLARADDLGYNEAMYTGAYVVSSADNSGKGREGVAASIARHARDAYVQNGVVFGCIAARMALLAEARFQFQRMADQGLFGTPDLEILEHPWPNADTGELFARLEQDDSTAGNSFWRYVDDGAGGGSLLVQMRPDTVTIISEEKADNHGRPYKVPIGYMQDMRALGIDADPQVFDVDEVVHYSPLPDPNASWRGMSWLTPILREVRADYTLTTYKISHLDNGALPGLVIKSPRKLGDPAIETLRKRLMAKYGGPDNAGKIIVLDEGLDTQVVGSSLNDLQADLVAKAGERRIASAAQVPLELLGLEQGDYQAAVRRFSDLWARPHWRIACASFQHIVPNMPPAGVRLWYDVSGIAALREGELSRGQTTLVKAQAVASFVIAGFTRLSAIAAAESGDLTQLVPDPDAPPPGVSSRETATEHLAPGQQPGEPVPAAGGPGGGVQNGRAPQAGVPQALPGVGKPNVPNALPGKPATMPALPGGARGAGRSASNGHG